MFNKKELAIILVAALVIGYITAFNSLAGFTADAGFALASAIGLALVVLFAHHLGQKFSALFYDCSTETHLWTVKQFWLARKSHFKFDFPIWAALPVFMIFFTFGNVKWLALTTFDATPLPARIHRKFAELTEWDLALIAAGGLFFNALLAVVSQAFGWHEFAMMNIYFIIFNLIPFSNLDGGKIFFGSIMLWIFCAVFIAIMLALLGAASLITTISSAVVLAIAAVILYYATMHS